MKTTSLISPDYVTFVADLKSRIASAHLSAARSVNRKLISLYWDIGQAIVEKQQTAKWGDSVIAQLASDLRAEFPDMQGFSEQNVRRMRLLYETFTSSGFHSQVVSELSAEKTQDLFLRQATAKLGGKKRSQAVSNSRKRLIDTACDKRLPCHSARSR